MLNVSTEPALKELKRLNINFTPVEFLANLESRDIANVTLFLAAGMDPNTKTTDGVPALHLAVQHPANDLAKLLLDYTAEINATDKRNWTALMLTAKKGDTALADFLLSRGANPNIQTAAFSWTALIFATHNNHLEIVKLLLDKGAEINSTTIFNETALMFAARNGYPEIAKLLIDKKAVLNAQDRYGWTALKFATQKNHPALVQLLQAAGAKE